MQTPMDILVRGRCGRVRRLTIEDPHYLVDGEVLVPFPTETGVTTARFVATGEWRLDGLPLYGQDDGDVVVPDAWWTEEP